MALEVDFLRDYIKNVVECTKPVDIKTLIYRGNGEVELAPGNNIPVIVPGWLQDQEININISCVGTIHKADINSSYGNYTATITASPDDDVGEPPHSHAINIKLEGKLKDGDAVIVARFSGLSKYIILEKINA